ncbi:MAG: cytochrome c oxidase subunit 1, partial [Haloarculaceae archaeon]
MAAAQLVLTALMGLLLVAVVALLARIEDWRSYSPMIGGAGGEYGRERERAHEEKPGGIVRWLTTVDHKDIGVLYGTYAIIAFVVGGLMAVGIRLQLLTPGGALFESSFYNSILTSHGITMLFLFGTPI